MKTIMNILLTFFILTALTFNLQAQEKSTTPVKKETTAIQPTKAQPNQAQVREVKPADVNVFAGKTFNVTIKEQGQADGNKDLLTFDYINFQSKVFEKKGFPSSGYTHTMNGEIPIFESTFTSETEGKITWKGMIKDGKLNGTAIWFKENKEPIRYVFMGTVVPTTIKEEKTEGAK